MRHLKIAVVAGSERITAHLIEAQLRKVLDSSDEVSLFTRSEVGEDVLEGFDVVLSTMPLPLSCDVPMIIVHEVFDEQEMLGRIRRAVKSGEAIYAADAGASPTIRSLLRPERFFRLEDVEDYAGGIARMVDDLIGQGCLDQGFAERLKKREQLHRMVFDHAVALPHCQQFATGDIVLALGTFPRPVDCGRDLVQVIFLLGVPETEWFAEMGERPFRAKQVMRWMHWGGAADFAEMTDLAKSLRAKLEEHACVGAPALMASQESRDGTRKWLLDVGTGNGVETVFIPESERGTLCISSQVGCALECTFYSTLNQIGRASCRERV